jgi:hypothetical protein
MKTVTHFVNMTTKDGKTHPSFLGFNKYGALKHTHTQTSRKGPKRKTKEILDYIEV